MPRDSASSSSSVTFKKPRRWTREQLTKTLQMLGPTPAPLPPQLPPSPPPSRSSSPNPGSKRKLGANGEADSAKRPRVGTAVDHTHSHHRTASTELSQHHRVTPDSAPSSVSVPGPSADGGASTPVLSSFPNIPPPSAVPIRRPRRGKMSPAEYENIHTKYHNAGRLLKYSGDARFWSTYPPSHREYKPLVNPPPPNSNYHKHGGIIARLELIDALVCFTYAMWAKDSSRRQCFFDNWKTIEGFLSWCKSKWKAEEQHTEAELAFLGLIWMIESFIETRKAFFAAKMLSTKMNNVLEKCTDAAVAVCDKFEAETGSKRPVGPQGTPPMLPSPASIGPSPSSHSTPNSCNDGTPNINGRSAQPRAPQPNHPRPLPSPMMEAVQKKRDGKSIPTEAYPALEKVSCSLEPRFMQEISQFTSHVMNAGFGMNTGQALLNLGVMSRAFPNTFARMIHTTLSHGDESEPDIEDEEGELFWPGQCITGEGLGWVCLMGRAMVYEFGKAYGYQGLKAAVPKPTDPSHPPTSVR